MSEWTVVKKKSSKKNANKRKRNKKRRREENEIDGWRVVRTKENKTPTTEDKKTLENLLTSGLKKNFATDVKLSDGFVLKRFPNTLVGLQTKELPPLIPTHTKVLVLLPQEVLNRFDVRKHLLETHIKILMDSDDDVSSIYKRTERLGVGNEYPSYLAETFAKKEKINIQCDETFLDIVQYVPPVLQAFQNKSQFFYTLVGSDNSATDLVLGLVTEMIPSGQSIDETVLRSLYQQNHICVSTRLFSRANKFYIPPRWKTTSVESGEDSHKMKDWCGDWSALYIFKCTPDTKVELIEAGANALGMKPPETSLETAYVFLG